MEKYFIIKKDGIEIYLFADTDMDDVIVNRQELYKVFEEAGFEVKEAPAEPPYESFVKTEKLALQMAIVNLVIFCMVTVTAESRKEVIKLKEKECWGKKESKNEKFTKRIRNTVLGKGC